MPDKKYDVAISLRWTDVEHARALYDLLRDRLEVFFAGEKQEDLVGTDGEESFGYIFRDQARVVVVLYRPDWGKTPFTRAEEAAIKQRAYDQGYGFSIWVPMDDDKSVPPYLSPQYIWFDFEQYGANGLATVIEERVRQSGREVRPETAIDRLRRIGRTIDLKERRHKFRTSQERVDFAFEAFQRLEGVLASQLRKYEGIRSDVTFNVERKGEDAHVTVSWIVTVLWGDLKQYRCVFNRFQPYTNKLEQARFTASIERFGPDANHRHGWQEPILFALEPTLDDDGNPSWKLKDGKHYSLNAAIARILDVMVEDAFIAIEKKVDKW